MNLNTNPNHIPSGPIDQFEIDDEATSFEPVGLPYASNNSNTTNMNTNLNTNGNSAMNTAPSFQNPLGSAAQVNNQPLTWYQKIKACFDISSHEQYFNVDTKDIKNRIIGSIVHANKPDYFREQILSDGETIRPDLYGPIWITMTLMFFLAVTSNTSKYLHTDSMKDFEYDIGHLTRALTTLTIYTFILPTMLFVMMRCINVEFSLVELICIYGYSLVPFIPTTILCLVPSVYFELMFLVFATIMSLLLVVRNIAGPVVRKSAQWGGPIVMCILACHFVFYWVLKLVFYRHRFHGKKNGGKNSDGGGNDDIIGEDDDGAAPVEGDDSMDPTRAF